MIEIVIAVYLAIGILLLLMVASYRNLIFERVKILRSSTRKLKYGAVGLGIIMVIFWVISVPLLKRQAKRDAFNDLMKALDDQEQQIHDPDMGYLERKRGSRYDPIEDNPEFQIIIDDVRAEADRRLELHPFRNGMGYCHPRWATVKLILREEHGIHWRTPVEMNPHICYD
jgi:hypothetical protein